MKYKSISVISVVILLLSVFTGLLNFESETLGEVPLGSRGAKTLYVGGTGAGNYTKIQDAIDNASAGDTIRVFNGVYNENIFINKRLTLIGNGTNKTNIYGTGEDLVYIAADWVNISGFNIFGNTSTSSYGIRGIVLENANNSRIIGNNISSRYDSNDKGLVIISSENNIIADNFVKDFLFGIHIAKANNNTIENNILTKNNNGLSVIGRHNVIVNNTITENFGNGIRTSSSWYNHFINNSISLNFMASVWIENSEQNVFSNNTISNNGGAFNIRECKRIILNNNSLTNNGIFIEGSELDYWNSHQIDKSNLINRKPIFYYKNQTNQTITIDAGQVILANCTNITVKNLALNKCSVGILLGFSKFNIITENKVTNNFKSGTGGRHGIKLDYSNNNKLINNSLLFNMDGIGFYNSHNNTLNNNKVSNNTENIFFHESHYNILQNNSVSWGNSSSIYLYHSGNNFLLNNTIVNDPIKNNGYGILLHTNSDNIIVNNTIIGSLYGLGLYYSNDNQINNNRVLNNKNLGISMKYSDNNLVYSNNFINNNNNKTQADDGTTGNFWNNTYNIGGNFWSDYSGADIKKGQKQNQTGSDGIGDSPYNITGSAKAKDFYPLMKPVDIGNISPMIPFPPQNLLATSGDGFVNLTWQAPQWDGDSPIKNYKIYRGTSPIGKTLLIQTGNFLFYNDTEVINNVTYYYQVRAVNAIGEGLLSIERSALPKKPTEDIPKTVPSQPINLKAKAGDGFVKLSWDPPLSNGNSSIINYYVYRGKSYDMGFLYKIIGNITFYNDTNVTNDILYHYNVSAINAIGRGPHSDEIFATPKNGTGNITKTKPSKPLNLRALSGDEFVRLTWDKPLSDGNATITNYLIYKGTKSGNLSFYQLISNLLAFNDTNVTNNITYFFKISAKNAIGEGPLSDEVSATPNKLPEKPKKTAPTSPCNLKATTGDGFVSLTWTHPVFDGNSSITNYKLYRGTTSTTKKSLIKLGNILKFNDTNVTNNITYYYEVSAINKIGEGPRSNEVIAKPNAKIIIINQTPPWHPQNLTARAGDEFVNLIWMAPAFNGNSTITNYRLYRSSISGANKFYKLLGTNLHYNDTNVTNNETYYYRVSAVNKLGEGALSNEVMVTPKGSQVQQTIDTDNDGIPDSWEQLYGFNITDPNDAQFDFDSDNLTNLEEYLHNTDPKNSDTDSDNLTDGDELKIYFTNPTNPDTDSDNLTDGDEIKIYGTNATNPDSDGDGYNDGVEIENNTDPLDENDHPTDILDKKTQPTNDVNGILIYSLIFVIIVLILIIFLLIRKRKLNIRDDRND